MSDQINELLEKVPAHGQSGGKYLDQLTPESREVLDKFQVWLVKVDGKKESTATGYKGYVAQALVHIEGGGQVKDLSTDVKSALNALKRFRDQDGVNTVSESEDEISEDIDSK